MKSSSNWKLTLLALTLANAVQCRADEPPQPGPTGGNAVAPSPAAGGLDHNYAGSTANGPGFRAFEEGLGVFAASLERRSVAGKDSDIFGFMHFDLVNRLDAGVQIFGGGSRGVVFGARADVGPIAKTLGETYRRIIKKYRTKVDKESVDLSDREARLRVLDLDQKDRKELKADTINAIYSLNIGVLASYSDVDNTTLGSVGIGISDLAPVGGKPGTKGSVGLRTSLTARALKFSSMGDTRIAGQLSGTAALQWPIPPTTGSDKVDPGERWTWTGRVGVEAAASSPRSVLEQYVGIFAAYRPVHDIELRGFFGVSRSSSIWGLRFTGFAP